MVDLRSLRPIPVRFLMEILLSYQDKIVFYCLCKNNNYNRKWFHSTRFDLCRSSSGYCKNYRFFGRLFAYMSVDVLWYTVCRGLFWFFGVLSYVWSLFLALCDFLINIRIFSAGAVFVYLLLLFSEVIYLEFIHYEDRKTSKMQQLHVYY